MAHTALTYQVFRHEVWKSLRLNALVKNPCATYALLGTSGFGIFLLLMHLPPLAFTWLLGMSGFSGWTAWRSINDPGARREAIINAVKKRFSLEELPSLSETLQEKIHHSVTIFGEIAVKVSEITIAHGEDMNLFHVFADADRMVSLQFESAKYITSFNHALGLISRKNRGSDANTLLQENISKLSDEIKKAEDTIDQSANNLDTFVIQLTRYELQPGDQVRIEDLKHGSSRAVEELQLQVDTQRSVAAEFMQRLSA